MTFIRAAILINLLFCSALHAQRDITSGTWYNEPRTGRIQFFMKDSKLYGKVVWLTETGKKDAKNPDPKLRDRQILGIVNLTGFVAKDQTTWTDGKIYDPESGKTYSSRITVVSDKELDVRGYVGTPLLGRTTKFIRAD